MKGIGKNLFLLLGVVVLLFSVFSWWNWYVMKSFHSNVNDHMQLSKEIDIAKSLQNDITMVWQYITYASLTKDKNIIDNKSIHHFAIAKKRVQEFIDLYKNHNNELVNTLHIIDAELQQMILSGTNMFNAYLNNWEKGNTAMVDFDKTSVTIIESVNSIVKELENKNTASRSDIFSMMESSLRTFVILVVAGSLVMLLIFIIAYRLETSIKEPLIDVANLSDQIANGNLTVSINHDQRNNEIGVLSRSFNHMIINLRNVVSKTVNAIDELQLSSEDIAQHTSEAAKSSHEATSVAMEGGMLVADAAQSSLNLSEIMKSSSNTISSLGEQSNEISEISDVIHEIADQTHLLALNAAIEAARAGDHGRGFAVVADEVRKLAERTTNSTGEITSKIKSIQKEINVVMEIMERGQKEVEYGRVHSNKASGSLQTIVTSIDNVTQLMQQIAASTEEQSCTARDIADVVNNTFTLTENSHNTETEVFTNQPDLNSKIIDEQVS